MGTIDDTVAVTNLINAYSHAVDVQDWDRVGAMFVDAELVRTNGDVARGRDDVVADYLARLPAGVRRKHLTSNVLVTLGDDGRSASAVSYWVLLREGSDGVETQVAGHYLDAFEKHDGAWHFTRRQMVRDLGGA